MRAARIRIRSLQSATAAISNDPAPALEDPADTDGRKSSELFRDDLLDRWSCGHPRCISNVDLATIAWRATKAGAKGVEDLAVDPRSKGRNHSTRVKKALGLDAVEDDLHKISLPVWDTDTASRVIGTLFVKLPHEALAKDFLEKQAFYEAARMDPDNYHVRSFLNKPTTKRFGANNCWPCGYYTDKVKLGNTEGFYRGSCKVTTMRSSITCWLLLVSQICKCGCNGNCTMDAIQLVMNDSFKWLQKKLYMAARFDMSPFHPRETQRAARANLELPIRGVLCEYRADLPERCMRAGTKNHQGFFGCLKCCEQSTKLHDHVEEVTLMSVPWTARTEEQYFTELFTHLVAIKVVNVADKTWLLDSLGILSAYPWGRVVKRGKGGRGLAEGDRLVISDTLQTIHDVELLIPPFELFFFRPRKDSGLQSISLMWNIPGVYAAQHPHD